MSPFRAVTKKTPFLERFARATPLLGVAGSLVVCLVVLASALAYSGRQAEPFSLLIPCAIGLGLRLRTGWSFLGMAAGVAAGVFLAGVGIFPMNDLPPHAFTAMWFFRAGLATVLLFGIAFAASPPEAGASSLDASFALRPRLWPLAALEWTVFFATILWFLGVSLLTRSNRRSAVEPRAPWSARSGRIR